MTSSYDPELVSIITPAFRAASIVGESIQSAIDQTYPEWEMLVVDDCSPDNTREVVESYSRKDARVKLIAHAARPPHAIRQ